MTLTLPLQIKLASPALVDLIFVRCMSRTQAFALAATLALCGCRTEAPFPETSADAEPLRWLDHADVIADFTEHVEHQHDTRFVSVFAFSTASAVGLADTPDIRKLLQQHGERHIEGTTDIITSAEQQRLLRKASDYAKQYNILLLQYLRSHPNTTQPGDDVIRFNSQRKSGKTVMDGDFTQLCTYGLDVHLLNALLTPTHEEHNHHDGVAKAVRENGCPKIATG